jgi:hypothetical protein
MLVRHRRGRALLLDFKVLDDHVRGVLLLDASRFK